MTRERSQGRRGALVQGSQECLLVVGPLSSPQVAQSGRRGALGSPGVGMQELVHRPRRGPGHGAVVCLAGRLLPAAYLPVVL